MLSYSRFFLIFSTLFISLHSMSALAEEDDASAFGVVDLGVKAGIEVGDTQAEASAQAQAHTNGAGAAYFAGGLYYAAAIGDARVSAGAVSGSGGEAQVKLSGGAGAALFVLLAPGVSVGLHRTQRGTLSATFLRAGAGLTPLVLPLDSIGGYLAIQPTIGIGRSILNGPRSSESKDYAVTVLDAAIKADRLILDAELSVAWKPATLKTQYGDTFRIGIDLSAKYIVAQFLGQDVYVGGELQSVQILEDNASLSGLERANNITTIQGMAGFVW